MGIYDRPYYRDDELQPLRPWDNRSAISLIIIANVALFVANFVFSGSSDLLTSYLVVEPQHLFQPWNWYRFITYGFAHASIGHILFNMLSLYFLGQSVEYRLGKAELIRFYLVAIVVCALVWVGVHAGSPNTPLLGASGGVTAVVMLFVFFFPQATLHIWGVLPVKAWVVGTVIVVMNVLGNPGDNVAYDVHLTGAAIAAVYVYGQLNFSSLTSWYSDWQQSRKIKRSGLKVHSSSNSGSGNESRDQVEADRILEKIHREGSDALTAKERKFMERYSRKVRERRGVNPGD